MPLGGAPEQVQLRHSGVVGDQPAPSLISQHDWCGAGAVAIPPRGDYGGSGLVGGCCFDVGDDKSYGKYPKALVRFR